MNVTMEDKGTIILRISCKERDRNNINI